MTQHSIRLATLVDLPSIRTLWKLLAAEMPQTYPEHALDYADTFTRSAAMALATEPPQVFCFLGQTALADAPDAMLIYEIQQRQLGEPQRMAFVHYCYVAPEARGQGMATALAQISMEHALTQGLTHAEITTAPGHPYWTDLGFEPYEVRYHTPIAKIHVGLEARHAKHVAATGNGLDHSETE